MHSPRYHRARAESARNGYKRECGPPTASSDKQKDRRAQSAIPSGSSCHHAYSPIPPATPQVIRERELKRPVTARSSSTSSSATTSCHVCTGGLNRADRSASPPRPPSTPRPDERARPSTADSCLEATRASIESPYGTFRRAASARGSPKLQPAPKPTPAIRVGCGHEACREAYCGECRLPHPVCAEDAAQERTGFLVDFDVCAELNNRICELSAKLAREEAEKRKKPSIPRTAKTIMQAVDKQFGDRWEQEREISRQLRKELEAKEATIERQNGIMKNLQKTIEAKNKISAGLLKQSEQWKGIIKKLDKALGMAKVDVSKAKQAQTEAEKKMEQYRLTYRPQAAAFLHSQYLLSNKEVERELATREVKKLEAELMKERHHSELMEHASIAAANSRQDAEEHAAELYGKFSETSDTLEDVRKRLKSETQKSNGLTERVNALQAKLATAEKDLHEAQSEIEQQSSMREAAELQCRELSEELELERSLHVSALRELQKEKEELSYVLKDRKELLDELEVMQKNQALLAQGKSSQITLTKKSVGAYYKMLRDTYEEDWTREANLYLMK